VYDCSRFFRVVLENVEAGQNIDLFSNKFLLPSLFTAAVDHNNNDDDDT